jgi:putative FmdB family regulatory protein
VPLFEYECQECNARFEQLEYGKGSQTVCRNCGSPKVKRLLSVFSVSASPPQKACADAGSCCACDPHQRAICQN